MIVTCVCTTSALAQIDASTDVEAAFASQVERGATLTDVRDQLLDAQRAGDTADVRFGVGACEFLLVAERVLQDLYASGFGSPIIDANGIASRSPLSMFQNLDPLVVSPHIIRLDVNGRIKQLENAEHALGQIEQLDDESFVVRIDIFEIRFDINADGEAAPHEATRELFGDMLPRGRFNVETSEYEHNDWSGPMVVAFDRGDADWLRGYCHLLMASGEFFLAHDFADWFERCGHVVFSNVQTQYDFLPGNAAFFEGVLTQPDASFDIMDALVLLTQIDWKVIEPKRLEASREHLLSAVGHSRAMWSHYVTETDDNAEWIPNPDQHAVITQMRITSEMPEHWDQLMAQIEKVLNGELLLPFWRNAPGRGLNLRRALVEHERFNPIFWLQGSDAAPFLEKGDIAEPEIWRDITEPFEGQMFRFGFWFNE